ncbi:Kelch repeat-containing protein [Pseudoalteromonas luteoviolacea]|uniref:Galactose oxidase n=1 Tax=Pseudoalteromonas luteoviolacea NCIMB 1942 TaxID=1365253 RepID=A0A166Y9G1_9GAMM|nr:kelch repeat-containing protein [Pseudoalteromonas luteoviolacea]KZN41590.1 hypothetical protein N482_20140 [Pseudoalteromonas luteoviolacea NCIMB 1942]
MKHLFCIRVVIVSVIALTLQACSSESNTLPQQSHINGFNWHLSAMLPSPLQEVYPAVFNNKIVVAGAFEQTQKELAALAHLKASDKTYIFDQNVQNWERGPVLPEPRHHLGLIANHDKLYAIGGFNATKSDAWQVKSSVFVLSEVDDAWSKGPELPIPMGESVYGVIDGQIHVAGGRTKRDGKLVDTNEHWVLKSDQWYKAAPLPIASNSATSVVLYNQWYVMGGRVNALDFKNLNALWRYNAQKDQWEQLASMPQASAGLASTVLDGKIYVFGGEEYTFVTGLEGQKEMKTRTFDQIWRYDPHLNAWSTMALPMTSTRHGLGAVTLNKQIYLLGGAVEAGATGTTAIVERLSLN